MATSLLHRPTADATAASPRGLLVAGLLAAVRAASLGLLPFAVLVLLGWATAAHGGADAGTALRAAGQLWLLAHFTPLHVAGGTVSVVPLGLVALPALSLFVAARREARNAGLGSPRSTAGFVGILAVGYATLTGLVAALSTLPLARPGPGRAWLGGLALAAGLGWWGASRVARSGPAAGSLRTQRREAARTGSGSRARAVLAGAGAAGATLVAAGTLLATVSLLAHAGEATDVARGLDAGPVGGALLLLLEVALVPNAGVYGAAFAVGPGFAVGLGSVVSLVDVRVGALPALPLLAALPGNGPATGALPVVLAPVAAGLVTAAVLGRRASSASPRGAALLGLAAGALAGLGLAALSALAGGSLGPGRLSAVGPSPWTVGLVAALEVGLVAAGAGSLAACTRRHRQVRQRGLDRSLRSDSSP